MDLLVQGTAEQSDLYKAAYIQTSIHLCSFLSSCSKKVSNQNLKMLLLSFLQTGQLESLNMRKEVKTILKVACFKQKPMRNDYSAKRKGENILHILVSLNPCFI